MNDNVDEEKEEQLSPLSRLLLPYPSTYYPTWVKQNVPGRQKYFIKNEPAIVKRGAG
jgi:hypothetical protein